MMKFEAHCQRRVRLATCEWALTRQSGTRARVLPQLEMGFVCC